LARFVIEVIAIDQRGAESVRQGTVATGSAAATGSVRRLYFCSFQQVKGWIEPYDSVI
jgi:hypothetical protein